MVRILTTQVVDVQRHQCVIGKTLEKFMRQVNIEGADHRALERHMEFQSGATRQIHHHARQCFVERHIGVTIAAQSFLVAHRFRKGLTEGDADIFHRVVRINVQIALGFDLQIHHAMARDLIEHVIEEGHAGIQLLLTAAIQIDLHADLRFQRVAGDFCLAHDGVS